MNIGNAIKNIRTKVGMNQRDFASVIEVTQTHLSLIESGKRKPSFTLMEKVSKETLIPLPLMFWLAMNEDDVKKNKEELFKILKPSIDALIDTFFNPINLK